MDLRLTFILMIAIVAYVVILIIGHKNNWTPKGKGIAILLVSVIISGMILLEKINPVYDRRDIATKFLTLGNTNQVEWTRFGRGDSHSSDGSQEGSESVFGSDTADSEAYYRPTAVYVEDEGEKENVKYDYTNVTPDIVDDHGAASGKTHLAANLIDGRTDTNWQEEREGYGIDETISFYFDYPINIEYISVYNGRQSSEDKFRQNCRIEDVYIEDQNGNGMAVTLQDIMGEQMMQVTGLTDVTELHWTIKSVYQGSKYEDTCLSQVEFYAN